MEEQILESMAWRYQSPLWEYLKSCDQPIPSCEEVSLPSQLLPPTPSAPQTPAVVQSSDPVRNTPQQPIPYSPSTYVTNKRAESSLAACKYNILSNFDLEIECCLLLALLQSPVSSVASVNERTPAQSSRRKLFPGPETVPPSPSNTAATPASVGNAIKASSKLELNDQKMELLPSPSVVTTADNKPKRTGSLSLFFRKVCRLLMAVNIAR